MSQSSLKNFSSVKLEQELNKRKISELTNQRAIIEDKIKHLNTTAVVSNKVEKLVKPTKSVKTIKSVKKKSSKLKKTMHKGRAVNAISLRDRLMTIASDGIVRNATQFLAILENDGWKSTSAKPYYVISAQLATLADKKLFNRVSKGSYQLSKNEPIVIVGA